MLANFDRAVLLERTGLARVRGTVQRTFWLLPLLLVVLLGSAAFAATVQVGGGDPASEKWSVEAGGETTTLENNQNPGNFVLKNNPGTSTVQFRVEDGNGEPITGWIEVSPGQESTPFGVGQGERVKIQDDGGTKGASGSIRASTV